MMTTTNSPYRIDDETYILTSRIQLKEVSYSRSDAYLDEVLQIVKDKILKNSLGTHRDSYIDEEGMLVVTYEVPTIVGKFLWSAPESLDKALLSEESRNILGIERSVTYDDFKGMAIRK